MSFPARVFRILIASPTDVTEEREIAVRVIQQWNDLNAAERQLVLLPLRWETHSAPEYGRRPQEIINRQVVDQCDLLVGVFWTRVGSPTGTAAGGTIEEIERVASQAKPVMLYFSQAKQDPDKIDLVQLEALRKFKTKTFPTALIENYSDAVEFRDKLSRQLEIQIKGLLASESEGQAQSALPITDIALEFADAVSGVQAGPEVSLKTQLIVVESFDEIPDYGVTRKVEQAGEGGGLSLWLSSLENKDYYRQRVTYEVLQGFFRPIRFWLKNRGGIGARDVYLDIAIRSSSSGVTIVTTDKLPTAPPAKSSNTYGVFRPQYATKPEEVIHLATDTWSTQMEVRALQPQRDVSPPPQILIGAPESCEVLIGARIYADTLPEPVSRELKLHLNVTRLVVSAADILRELAVVDEQALSVPDPLLPT